MGNTARAATHNGGVDGRMSQDISEGTTEPVGPTEWTYRHEVGVGPWEGPWPEDDRYDPELLRHGDRRNVVDAYRYWRREAIVADLDTRRHPFHVAIENFQHDHNIGTVVRTASSSFWLLSPWPRRAHR